MKEKKGFLLRTVKEMNRGAVVSGIGFLLYLLLRATGLESISDVVVIVFAVISAYTFLSVAAGRMKDKEAVSYSLLWGTGALALMLVGFAFLTIRMHLGL